MRPDPLNDTVARRLLVAPDQRRDFPLGHYLQPGGRLPFGQLFPDLERALADGFKVYLWSVAGFLVLSGHRSEWPWHDGTGGYYKTAAECYYRKDPTYLGA